MARMGLMLASAVAAAAGGIALSAPGHAAAGILVASCDSTAASCYNGDSPTPWSYDLSGAQLTALGLGATVPLNDDQTGCCVIRLGSLQIVFQTTTGPVTETAPEYNGTGVYPAVYLITDYMIPANATSAVISGTFGNSTVPNSALEKVYFGSVVPEPATWALMMLGVFGVGAAMRSRREAIA